MECDYRSHEALQCTECCECRFYGLLRNVLKGVTLKIMGQCDWFYCCDFVEIQVPPQLDPQKNTLHALMWKLTVLVKVGLKSNKIM